jgi:hypothetical protein
MASPRPVVLTDTNVILEGFRTATWRALAGGHPVETVTDCVTETQTGFQNRAPEQRIDERELRASLKAVHDVSQREYAVLATRDHLSSNLDAGEKALWAHAVARPDAWILCGPDKASLRLGIRLGLRDRLVAMEALLSAVGHTPKILLRPSFTTKWLTGALADMAALERRT